MGSFWRAEAILLTGAEGQYAVESSARGPDLRTFPKSKVDRVIVSETPVLEGAQGRYTCRLEQTGHVRVNLDLIWETYPGAAEVTRPLPMSEGVG